MLMLSKPRNPLKRLEEGKNALSAASIISALAKNQNICTSARRDG
jgi:hypothetical protein